MAADVGTGCAKRRKALCNHFYFPLLASLLSDLDCISQGRQRQNKGMLVMVCLCVCVNACSWVLLKGSGRALRMVRGSFNKGAATLWCN